MFIQLYTGLYLPNARSSPGHVLSNDVVNARDQPHAADWLTLTGPVCTVAAEAVLMAWGHGAHPAPGVSFGCDHREVMSAEWP